MLLLGIRGAVGKGEGSRVQQSLDLVQVVRPIGIEIIARPEEQHAEERTVWVMNRPPHQHTRMADRLFFVRVQRLLIETSGETPAGRDGMSSAQLCYQCPWRDRRRKVWQALLRDQGELLWRINVPAIQGQRRLSKGGAHTGEKVVRQDIRVECRRQLRDRCMQGVVGLRAGAIRDAAEDRVLGGTVEDDKAECYP